MMIHTALAVAVLTQNTVMVTNKQGASIKRNHYSMFYETEINFGGEGGMYAEMVWNRDFEALGRGHLSLDTPPRATREERREFLRREAAKGPNELGLDPGEPVPVYSSVAPWAAVGSSLLANQNVTAPYATNPFAVNVTTFAANQGISNPGYWGMNVRTETTYNISLWALAPGSIQISARLVCNGAAVASVATFQLTGAWTRYTAVLAPTAACFGASLEIVSSSAGSFMLDHVSLFPGDAVAGLFRPDLFQFLKEYQPPMIRLPGGNYLEGTGPRTRWQWKKSVGPVEQRSGHYNSAWGYWVTDGLGLLELLILCEVLEAEPLVSIYTGYSIGQQYVPLNQSQQFVEDALDLMEYSNGAASTLWGGQRAADGHPAPFNVKMLEIGNEETQQGKEGYAGHYQIIADPLRAQYPGIFIVASGVMVATGGGRSTSCLPCVGGCDMPPQQCDAWDEHTYDNADTMASLIDLYNNYYSTSFCQTTAGNQCPPVYVLEFACAYQPLDMQSGVAEGVFLVGTERNAAAVYATAFAPLFDNVHGQQWGYNLINFNASHVFTLPSYSTQLIMKRSLGDYILQTDLSAHESGASRWSAIASIRGNNTVIVKVANYEYSGFSVDISFNGFPTLTFPSTFNYVGGNSATAQNTLDAPNTIGITTRPLTVNGQTATVALDLYGVGVFEATF